MSLFLMDPTQCCHSASLWICHHDNRNCNRGGEWTHMRPGFIITSIEACNVCLSSCAIRWSRVSIFLVGRILLGILYIFNWHRCFDCDIHTLFKSKGAFTPLLQKRMFKGYEFGINILIINYSSIILPLLGIPDTLFLKFNVWVKVTNKYQSLYILTQIARIHVNKRIENLIAGQQKFEVTYTIVGLLVITVGTISAPFPTQKARLSLRRFWGDHSEIKDFGGCRGRANMTGNWRGMDLQIICSKQKWRLKTNKVLKEMKQ